jgi:HAD superfamily hydrolase (TIGR01509 family)
MRRRMIRALIMDFDGLILDTEVPSFQSWDEIFQEYGCSLHLSAWAAWLGGSPDMFDPYEYLETQLGRAVDREEIRRKQVQREAELIEAQAILPGVEDCIADAKRLGLKLGVASSSDREWVFGHLSRLGLIGHFDGIKCLEDVETAKPDPGLFLAVLDELGIGPDEAVVLEDSPHGITAAKAAGIFCVAVPNSLTRQLSTDHADLRLDSLAELPLEELLLRVESEA